MKWVLAMTVALAVGCGPMHLAGNWSFQVDPASSNPCIGTMALGQSGTRLTGQASCTGAGQAGGQLNDPITGAIDGESVSMSWGSPGFVPYLVTATAHDERTLTGTINGPRINNATFTATRL